jgi:AcrR family transcriptional regulator
VADYQRRRILLAATAAFARGYDRTAVEDIVESAGVSRRTIYELFDGKDAIFRAAHGRALTALGRSLRDAERLDTAGRAGAETSLAALLDWAAAEPAPALLVFAPALVAGPHARLARRRLFAALGPSLGVGAPRSGAPASLPEALLGGLAELIAGRLLAGEAATLPSLAPALSRFVCAYREAFGSGRSTRGARAVATTSV